MTHDPFDDPIDLDGMTFGTDYEPDVAKSVKSEPILPAKSVNDRGELKQLSVGELNSLRAQINHELEVRSQDDMQQSISNDPNCPCACHWQGKEEYMAGCGHCAEDDNGVPLYHKNKDVN